MKTLNNHKKIKYGQVRQSGFSLVELLIASTLGLFIMGGVITSFSGTKDSEQMRSAVSEMDANARTALEILRKSISLAGYSSMRNIQDFNKPFYTAIDEGDAFTSAIDRTCGDGTTTTHITGHTPALAQYTDDSNKGDVLTAVFLADNPCSEGNDDCSALADVNPKAMVYTDCAGGVDDRDAQAVSCSTDKDVGMQSPSFPVHAKLYSTFYLGDDNEDDKRILYCRGNRGGTVPLVEDVEYLQFLYGVTRSNGTTEYMRADNIETGSLWEFVTSVRVGLLMRSSRKNLLKKASTKDRYLLLDRNVPVDDMHRLYRVYTTTINLPNRNRGNVI